MLSVARLGIAVVGAEGASATTLRAADGSILDALGLLLNETAIVSTLRP
jgi:hypothetical protein